MIAAGDLLAASPRIAQGLALVVLIGAVALLVRSLFAASRPAPDARATIGRRHELALLGLVLTGAVAMRLAWCRSDLTAPFWFPEAETLHVAKLLQSGTAWSAWRRSWGNFQVGWLHDSPLMLPVALAFQRVLGPSFHLPLVIGAFYGTAGVLLAWAAGRAAHSPPVGLLFAAFVAASPLELVWSRLGGLYIACVPQVLLTIWLGLQAGRRGSLVLAVLSGLVAWSSLYYYYAARVAIPLVLVAVAQGLQRTRTSFLKAVALVACPALTMAAVFLLCRMEAVLPTVWPSYTGYIGNRGEHSLAEVLQTMRGSVDELDRQLRYALEQYFLYDRAGAGYFHGQWLQRGGGRALGWGIDHGGLCLAPAAALGGLGLLSALRRPTRSFLWLLLTAAGLALPVLSFTTARRLLVLDLGWCALASLGAFTVLRSRLCDALPPRVVGGLAVFAFALLGAWSFTCVTLLNATLPKGGGEPIPFGESGFGDGLTCLRCFEAGHEWRREFAAGAFVVLSENDLERENRTSPGGLPLYGKLAALVAGQPDRFLDLYAAMADFDVEPPSVGPLYDGTRMNFDAWVVERIEKAQPSRILWHFERPTQWERWLAGRLARAGGTLRTFTTPLSATPAIEVATPWAARDGAFAVLRELAAPLTGDPAACFELRKVATTHAESLPLALAGVPEERPAAAPDWAIGSWHVLQYRGRTMPATEPAGLAVERDAGMGGVRIHLLGRWGEYGIYEAPSGATRAASVPVSARQGLGCAVRVGERWWIVDPTTGRLLPTDPGAGWVPAGAWTGIGRTPDGDVLLASAEQALVVLDVARHAERARFSALVGPSRRVTTGECTPVLAGDGWYATFNNLTSALSVYDTAGRPLGTARLDRVLGLGANTITAVGAAGNRVGVGYATNVDTLELEVHPGCTVPASPSP
ncbi:MAG: glycosyltransferase family 39 protein [Deltaproteobacteria bacterium]|nr:MAG: glycosyltransferase family 39 protein [Deltaproteobacteria bacterium]